MAYKKPNKALRNFRDRNKRAKSNAEADRRKIKRCYDLICKHFTDDEEVIGLWFVTPNVQLGCVTPLWMITMGRADKLLIFIENMIDGFHP